MTVPDASSASAVAPGDGSGDAIKAQIEQQGNKVRDLKAAKASKDVIDAEVKALLELKAKYKEVTGQDYAPPAGAGGGRGGGKKDAKKETKPAAAAPPPKADKGDGAKKQTRLGLEAKKLENLPEWYSQVTKCL